MNEWQTLEDFMIGDWVKPVGPSSFSYACTDRGLVIDVGYPYLVEPPHRHAPPMYQVKWVTDSGLNSGYVPVWYAGRSLEKYVVQESLKEAV
jgi:hypothetical protein